MKTAKRRVAGVDGCRAGWALALRDGSSAPFGIEIIDSFEAVVARAGPAAMLIVDMPIGLAEGGRRICEREARALLGPRRSSVFAAPRRPMLSFGTYAAANAWGKSLGPEGGGGLSKQAWHLMPKIREIDSLIDPADQDRIGEGHPEVAFARLNAGPCAHPKRSPEGVRERMLILKRAGVADPAALIERAGRAAKADDVLDALALCLTAAARLDGSAWRLGDGARDARGLVMEIWG